MDTIVENKVICKGINRNGTEFVELGEFSQLPEIDIPETKAFETDCYIEGYDLSQNEDCTFTFTPRFRHVSRKQLIRNLIKMGCPKKVAKEIAWNNHKDKIEYSYANFLYNIGVNKLPVIEEKENDI